MGRLFAGYHVPHTIRGEQEHRPRRENVGRNLGHGCDDLVGNGQLREVLVLEVADGAGEVELAVDPPLRVDAALRRVGEKDAPTLQIEAAG